MIGKHIGSLEGRAAEIEYDRFAHSYKEEEYGKHIAELILKQSYGIEDYSEQIPSGYIIWQDNKYALLFDKYECIFDLFQISDNTNESVKASAKLIRLTESDLHRIVKESVKKILAEADPRSWDAVARRYDQTDPKKADYARKRAAQQWNSKFSKPIDNDLNRNDVQMYGDSRYFVSGNQYSKLSGGDYALYDPYHDTTKEHKVDKNGNMMWDRPETWNRPEMKGAGGNIMSKQRGLDVARQMAQGNGVYDKTKGGWQ